jgi:hypothetical protein
VLHGLGSSYAAGSSTPYEEPAIGILYGSGGSAAAAAGAPNLVLPPSVLHGPCSSTAAASSAPHQVQMPDVLQQYLDVDDAPISSEPYQVPLLALEQAWQQYQQHSSTARFAQNVLHVMLRGEMPPGSAGPPGSGLSLPAMPGLLHAASSSSTAAPGSTGTLGHMYGLDSSSHPAHLPAAQQPHPHAAQEAAAGLSMSADTGQVAAVPAQAQQQQQHVALGRACPHSLLQAAGRSRSLHRSAGLPVPLAPRASRLLALLVGRCLVVEALRQQQQQQF